MAKNTNNAVSTPAPLDGNKCHISGCDGTFKKTGDNAYTCSANYGHTATWKPDVKSYVYVPVSGERSPTTTPAPEEGK